MLTTVCLHLNEPKQPTGSHPQPHPKTITVHRGTYCVEFLSSDVGFFAWCESSERLLHLRARLDVLCLATDHEGHVLLQWHVAIPETSTKTSADCTVSVPHCLAPQQHTTIHDTFHQLHGLEFLHLVEQLRCWLALLSSNTGYLMANENHISITILQAFLISWETITSTPCLWSSKRTVYTSNKKNF